MVGMPYYTRAHILTEAPFRIPLGGGGTDVDWYAKKHGGSWGAAAIDLHCCVLLSKRENPAIRIASSDTVAIVDNLDALPQSLVLIKEALKRTGTTSSIEISTQADVSSRAGLGGSGAMLVALLKALREHLRESPDQQQLAEEAYRIEVDLGAPIGPQDQYAAALGGINWYERDTDGSVWVTPLYPNIITATTLSCLEEGLLLFDTGFRHSTSKILGEHKEQARKDPSVIENLHRTKEIGLARRKALEKGDLDEFGHLLHEHWQMKRKRASNISRPEIDEWYEEGIKAGATGGYLLGAGGGGHLTFWVNSQRKAAAVRERMNQLGLRERLFRFDMIGVTMPYSRLR